MLKECTILTFEETEILKSNLDHVIKGLKKASNNDCDGMSPEVMCGYLVKELKSIRDQFD